MATATAKIFVDGVDLKPYHVHVEQRSDWHHSFEITISTEKAELGAKLGGIQEGTIIDAALNKYTGKQADITFDRENGTFNFKGYVTQVRIDQTYAGDSYIILQGYSPTYFLDGRRSVNSYEEKSLEDIFNAEMASFPANVEQEVKPKYKKPIPYIVRYKETQYQFLSRLAATYGEWFYYDGQKIVFGELPSSNPQTKLTFGSDSMLSFNYGLTLKPSSFKQQFYKYEENSVIDKSMKSFQPGWLDTHSKISLSESKKLFAEEGLDPVIFDVKNDSQIKHLAEAKKSSLVGDAMIFNGQSANPGITIGAEVAIDSRSGSFIGNYRVISATHSFDSNRDYSNVFKAIPVSTMVPPRDWTVEMPEAETQVAEVVENNDPDKLGRVRLKFKWQEGRTPWVRVITGYGGGNGESKAVVGLYFTPEIGDEVFVDFEQGNPARPIVIGSKYHGTSAPGFAHPDNNLKVIKTRSGHTIMFDDKSGKESIMICDKGGNVVNLNTSGKTISISSQTAVSVSSKDITLAAASNVTISAGEDVNINAGNNVVINGEKGTTLSAGPVDNFELPEILGEVVGKVVDKVKVFVGAIRGDKANVTIKSEEGKVEIEADKDITGEAKKKISFDAKEINLEAKSKIEQVSNGSFTAKSKGKMALSAKAKLEQKGGTVEIASQGPLKINSSAIAQIKASIIKLN